MSSLVSDNLTVRQMEEKLGQDNNLPTENDVRESKAESDFDNDILNRLKDQLNKNPDSSQLMTLKNDSVASSKIENNIIDTEVEGDSDGPMERIDTDMREIDVDEYEENSIMNQQNQKVEDTKENPNEEKKDENLKEENV